MPGTYYFFTIFRSIPILQIFHIRMSRQIWTMEMTEYNLYAFIIHHILHCISLPLRALIPLLLRTFQNQICILTSYHRRRRWRTAGRFYFIKYPARIPAVTVVTVAGIAGPHTYISAILRNFQHTHIPNYIANTAVLPVNRIGTVWRIYIMLQYTQWFFCILRSIDCNLIIYSAIFQNQCWTGCFSPAIVDCKFLGISRRICPAFRFTDGRHG